MSYNDLKKRLGMTSTEDEEEEESTGYSALRESWIQSNTQYGTPALSELENTTATVKKTLSVSDIFKSQTDEDNTKTTLSTPLTDAFDATNDIEDEAKTTLSTPWTKDTTEDTTEDISKSTAVTRRTSNILSSSLQATEDPTTAGKADYGTKGVSTKSASEIGSPTTKASISSIFKSQTNEAEREEEEAAEREAEKTALQERLNALGATFEVPDMDELDLSLEDTINSEDTVLKTKETLYEKMTLNSLEEYDAAIAAKEAEIQELEDAYLEVKHTEQSALTGHTRYTSTNQIDTDPDSAIEREAYEALSAAEEELAELKNARAEFLYTDYEIVVYDSLEEYDAAIAAKEAEIQELGTAYSRLKISEQNKVSDRNNAVPTLSELLSGADTEELETIDTTDKAALLEMGDLNATKNEEDESGLLKSSDDTEADHVGLIANNSNNVSSSLLDLVETISLGATVDVTDSEEYEALSAAREELTILENSKAEFWYSFYGEMYEGLSDEAHEIIDDYIDAQNKGSAVMTKALQISTLRDQLEEVGVEENNDTVQSLVEYRKQALNAEDAEEREAKLDALASGTVLEKTLASVAAVPLTLIGVVGYADILGQQVTQAMTGVYAPIDYNTQAVQVGTLSSDITAAVSEDMGEVGSFLYNTGMSMASSAVVALMTAAGVPAVLGTSLLGGSAATNATVAAKESGASDEQALLQGLAQGVAELVFEKVSIGNLLSLKSATSVRSAITNVLQQSGVEASEELFTSLTNTITDAVIMGELSSYNQAVQSYLDQGYSETEADELASKDLITQLALDTLAGAISGGVLGGGATAIQTIANNSTTAIEDTVATNLKSVFGFNVVSNSATTTKKVLLTEIDGLGTLYADVSDTTSAILYAATAYFNEDVTEVKDALKIAINEQNESGSVSDETLAELQNAMANNADNAIGTTSDEAADIITKATDTVTPANDTPDTVTAANDTTGTVTAANDTTGTVTPASGAAGTGTTGTTGAVTAAKDATGTVTGAKDTTDTVIPTNTIYTSAGEEVKAAWSATGEDVTVETANTLGATVKALTTDPANLTVAQISAVAEAAVENTGFAELVTSKTGITVSEKATAENLTTLLSGYAQKTATTLAAAEARQALQGQQLAEASQEKAQATTEYETALTQKQAALAETEAQLGAAQTEAQNTLATKTKTAAETKVLDILSGKVLNHEGRLSKSIVESIFRNSELREAFEAVTGTKLAKTISDARKQIRAEAAKRGVGLTTESVVSKIKPKSIDTGINTAKTRETAGNDKVEAESDGQVQKAENDEANPKNDVNEKQTEGGVENGRERDLREDRSRTDEKNESGTTEFGDLGTVRNTSAERDVSETEQTIRSSFERTNDLDAVSFVPDEIYTAEQNATAELVEQYGVKGVSFVYGKIVDSETGKSMRGVYNDEIDWIILRADADTIMSGKLTLEQTARHEIFHSLAAKDKIDITHISQSVVANQKLRRSFEKTRSVYEEKYRGVIQIGDSLTLSEEIFADAFAKINAYGATAKLYSKIVISEVESPKQTTEIRNHNKPYSLDDNQFRDNLGYPLTKAMSTYMQNSYVRENTKLDGRLKRMYPGETTFWTDHGDLSVAKTINTFSQAKKFLTQNGYVSGQNAIRQASFADYLQNVAVPTINQIDTAVTEYSAEIDAEIEKTDLANFFSSAGLIRQKRFQKNFDAAMAVLSEEYTRPEALPTAESLYQQLDQLAETREALDKIKDLLNEAKAQNVFSAYTILDNISYMYGELADLEAYEGDLFILNTENAGSVTLRGEKGVIEYAQSFAENTEHEYFLNVTKPYIVNAKGSDVYGLNDEHGNTVDDIADWAEQQKRYDGVIFLDLMDSDKVLSTGVIIFETDQAKSTTDQNPTRSALSLEEDTDLIDDPLTQRIKQLMKDGELFEALTVLQETQSKESPSTDDFYRNVGAAEAGFFSGTAETQREQLVEDYGAIPKGENPQGTNRNIQIPRNTSPDQRVSDAFRTTMESEVTPDEFVPYGLDEMAKERFSYAVVSDAAAKSSAQKTIRTKGYQTALRDWTSDMRSGKTTKDLISLGYALYNEAVNAGSYSDAIDILSDITDGVHFSAQVVQAARLLKQLSPAGQLYSIDNMTKRVEERANQTPKGRSAQRKNAQKANQGTQSIGSKLTSAVFENYPSWAWGDKTGAILATKVRTLSETTAPQSPETIVQTVLADLVNYAKTQFAKEQSTKLNRSKLDKITDYMQNQNFYENAWQEAQRQIREKYGAETLEVYDTWLETSINQAVAETLKPTKIGETKRTKLTERLTTALQTGGFSDTYIAGVLSDYVFQDGVTSVTVDPDLQERFLAAEDEEQRAEVLTKIYKNVANQIPSNLAEKINSWRYLAMLCNPRTHFRNIVSNAVFTPIRLAKNAVATTGEIAGSVISGGKMQRTKAFLNPLSKTDQALKQAAIKSYDAVQGLILQGGKYDLTETEIDRYRTVFKNEGAWGTEANSPKTIKALRKISDILWKAPEALRHGNTRALDVEDVWFSKPAYTSSLASYLKANNYTAEDVRQQRLSAEQWDAAQAYAIKEAQKATFRDSNIFSDAVMDIGRTYNKNNAASRLIAASVSATLPFRRTPANIMARGAEYSPFGLVAGVWRLTYGVATGKKSATEALDTFASGFVGTGIVLAGMLLRHFEIIGGQEDDDESQADFDDLLGKQEYALYIGDYSYTIDWLTPLSLPLFAGVELYERWLGEESSSGMLTELVQALSTITEPVLSLSMLSSVNDLLDSVEYSENKIAAAAGATLASYISQFVPTFGGQVERAFTETERESTYTDKNNSLDTDIQYNIGKIFNKIPGVEYSQIPYIDAWGQTEDSGGLLTRVIENFISPGYIDEVSTDEVETELQRLYDATGESGVLPNTAEKYFTVNSERVDLTAEEYVEYATEKGQTSYNLVTTILNSEAYNNLSDKIKSAAVELAYDYATQTAKLGIYSEYSADSWVLALNGENDSTIAETIIAKAISAEADSTSSAVSAISKAGLSDALALAEMSDTAQENYQTYLADTDVSVAEYAEAYQFKSSASADTDEEGSTINGSKKTKVVNYIDDLSLSEVDKAALCEALGYTLSDTPWE